MKLITNIYKAVWALAIPCCMLTGCNYLDVIPPAQPDFEDTMKDEARTLEFLYSCYGYIPYSQPFDFKSFEQSADEIAAPVAYSDYQQQVAWGQFLLLITIVGEEMT